MLTLRLLGQIDLALGYHPLGFTEERDSGKLGAYPLLPVRIHTPAHLQPEGLCALGAFESARNGFYTAGCSAVWSARLHGVNLRSQTYHLHPPMRGKRRVEATIAEALPRQQEGH